MNEAQFLKNLEVPKGKIDIVLDTDATAIDETILLHGGSLAIALFRNGQESLSGLSHCGTYNHIPFLQDRLYGFTEKTGFRI